jgi:hypothetical protein
MWNDVKTRLPEKDGNYLVVTDENVCVCEYRVRCLGMFVGGWNSAEKVTHWMEIPEVPKKREPLKKADLLLSLNEINLSVYNARFFGNPGSEWLRMASVRLNDLISKVNSGMD